MGTSPRKCRHLQSHHHKWGLLQRGFCMTVVTTRLLSEECTMLHRALLSRVSASWGWWWVQVALSAERLSVERVSHHLAQVFVPPHALCPGHLQVWGRAVPSREGTGFPEVDGALGCGAAGCVSQGS